MPATERYQVDIFGIIILIAAVLILVFLVIVAIYFYDLMNLKPPTRGESTFLFWTSIVMAIIFAAIIIYAMIHIFTHKSIVYEEPNRSITRTVITPPNTLPVATPTVTPVTPRVVTPVVTPVPTSSPVLISNIPQTTRVTNQSVSFSDIPVNVAQRNALNGELMSLGSSIDG